MKILILSDIHGNLEALRSLKSYLNDYSYINKIILLGDIIDYGMHSNEVVEEIKSWKFDVLCNIRGNHEHSIITDDYARFSSERGRECAKYTKSILSDSAWEYISNAMHSSGKFEFAINGKKCLAVHGSLEDIYWKSISPDQTLEEYQEYDYVFSGHSHLPHFFEKFYKTEDKIRRNKKKTVFINPGSLGQPRNLNPMAQFAVLDIETEEIQMIKLPYDIKKEQLSYTGQVDDFYKIRLESGV